MNISRLLVLYIGIFACLLLAFSPVLLPYVAGDSIRYFHKFFNEGTISQEDPFHDLLLHEGRPFRR